MQSAAYLTFPHPHLHHPQQHYQPSCGPDHFPYSGYSQSVPYFATATYPLMDPGVLDAPPPSLTLPPYHYDTPSLIVDNPLTHAPHTSGQVHAYATHGSTMSPPPPPIYAPVPVSAYAPLLASHSSDASSSPPLSEAFVPPAPSAPYVIQVSPAPQPGHSDATATTSSDVGDEEVEPPLDTLKEYASPQVMFPTPSDMLNEADRRARDEEAARSEAASPGSTAGSSSTRSSRPSQSKGKGKAKARASTSAKSAAPAKTENLRKSYFRGISDKVGFKSTDPDTITSHDKKRHYLECLEQYIVWLHEQIKIAGLVPRTMQRLDTHPGLNSQSIRTLLLHMEDTTKALHANVVEEERKYFESQKYLFPREEQDMDVEPPLPAPHPSTERVRRHSIANGMIPMCPASHVPALSTSSSLSAAGTH